MIDLKDLINKICLLVKDCGKVILTADREKMAIDTKSGIADLVTEYDKKIQEQLAIGLKKILPEAKFIGEEGSSDKLSDDGYAFVVDPIDGTTNFIKDFHISAISVALLEGKEVVAGVVYNPYLDEIFYAIKGQGAFCNGKKISVSSQPMSNALVLFGSSPYDKSLFKETLEILSEYFYKALDIRRCGSAALDLCSVACGRAEVYFELQTSPWDFAAGKLLVEEAGGVVTTLDAVLYNTKDTGVVLSVEYRDENAELVAFEDFDITGTNERITFAADVDGYFYVTLHTEMSTGNKRVKIDNLSVAKATAVNRKLVSTVTTAATSYAFNALEEGVTYLYRVKAANGKMESPFSDYVEVALQPTGIDEIVADGDWCEVYAISGVKLYSGDKVGMPVLSKGVYVVVTSSGTRKIVIQ